MRFRIFVILVVLLSCSLKIKAQYEDSIFYDLDIEEVTIQRRPSLIINEIGPAKTDFDSPALRENITVNLAEKLSDIGSVFIKSYGRSTLSTASFRGTSPSHTQVTWNGMKINSPMLGMVDLSAIPTFFVDKMEVSIGSATVGVASGGIGGAIELETLQSDMDSVPFIQYVQGISSYNTYDQYIDLSFGREKISGSTKLYYTSSKNDFRYINYRKKVFVFDDNGDVTDSYYPEERNKNGFYKDFHALQEIYLKCDDGSLWSATVWFMDSKRGIPMLNVDYRTTNLSENRQDDITVRSIVSWDKEKERSKYTLRGGYIHSDLRYFYLGDAGNGNLKKMVDSNSKINTLFLSWDSDFKPTNNLSVSLSVSFYQHFVTSIDNALTNLSEDRYIIGYEKARFEPSAILSVKYRPLNRMGLSATIREDIYGKDMVPPIPALFADYLVSRRWNIILKSSVARNSRYPTLNDLYFSPGGNPELKSEKGYTYDFGVSFGIEESKISLNGDISFFGSKIKDWILWLPTYKGYWSPFNIKQVDSRGMETSADMVIKLTENKSISVEGNFTVTRSINNGDPVGLLDESIGKQLVYVPLYSSAINGIFISDGWKIKYSWNYYSKRYTTSNNNEGSIMGVLGNYFMNDISIEKDFSPGIGSLSAKIMVNNLFDEEYESVLSRPMPGRNYCLMISFTPNAKKSLNKYK